ncbi:phosphoribosyl-ATP diphosphatase [Enterococcus avium]|uniref:phosphoribosyl-ATP diphosphatase n=1 Tax=Enterococcus avium TaxID=33945 RepID=UPI000C9D134B|nr:phosphoribosyl-ATP diphosphatase [Enterococcus avium]PNE49946.1 phosphoribosyl-ATP diphosphatase [Enterococcus avium]
MKIKIKKISGEEFDAETNKTMDELYAELTDQTVSSFILLGDHIEQKMTIDSIRKINE